MRNGNSFDDLSQCTEQLSSYRTYEEWKQFFNDFLNIPIYYSSYRTYEEWKLYMSNTNKTIMASSYRTYEEWKRPRHYQ